MKIAVFIVVGMLAFSGCIHRPPVEQAAPEPELEIQGAMCCIPFDQIESVTSAALAGDVESMLKLTRHYHLCLYSAEMAVPWARMAAGAGSSEAKYRLAVMLFWDDADRTNDQEAIDLLRELAAQGYENAGDLLKTFEEEHEANQALQTNSVTRSGFGKVSVSDRQRRGV